MRLGYIYELKVATRSLFEKNEVEVIVEGSEDNIKRFWEHVKKEDVRLVKNGKGHTLTELEPYKETEPDWSYQESASFMELIYKGVEVLDRIKKKLDVLDDELRKISEKYRESKKDVFG